MQFMYSSEEIRRRNRDQAGAEADPFTEDRYRQFARFLVPGWEVLDVGCSTGRGGVALAKARGGLTMDGLEMLSERLEQVPPGLYRQVYDCSLEDLVESGEAYDSLLLGEVIEHVPYSGLDGFVVSLLTLLRPGGLVVLTTPNPHSLLSRIKHRGVLGGAHVSVHCATCLGELFRLHGASSYAVRGSGKSSRYVGMRMPLGLYGAYLMIVRK